MTEEEIKLARRVEATSFALLEDSQRFEKYRLYAHATFFGMTLLSLFESGYVVYLCAIVAVVAEATAFWSRLMANHRSSIGHSLLRVSMLIKAFEISPSDFEIAYTLSRISPRIRNNAQEKLKSPEHSGDYAVSKIQKGLPRLRWMVQENSYFNTILYDLCANRSLYIFLTTAIVVIMFVFLILPVAGRQTEFTLPRLFIIVLSLAALYDQIEKWFKWRQGSRIMLHLEQELARIHVEQEHKIMLMFCNYHNAISSCDGIMESIYELHRDELNCNWEQRFVSLVKENSESMSLNTQADATT